MQKLFKKPDDSLNASIAKEISKAPISIYNPFAKKIFCYNEGMNVQSNANYHDKKGSIPNLSFSTEQNDHFTIPIDL
ncbi:MAG: hypothetical protein MRQ09_01910 [Candidatus Midichloria sp.]|nr:hypothetical protein [Candidatus Midichloria sp.]